MFVLLYAISKEVIGLSMEIISSAQLIYYLNHPEYRIVDLRARNAFLKGHIQGAIHVPYDEYQEKFQLLSKNMTYILYCDKGGSSLLAARWLDQHGFNVLSLNGGISAYPGPLFV